ncbi:hypothetical protein [Acidimangrovimonas sediminis]|uniref:hypothetical protein n=1 Tax=Acidimangrovimonas sediminis TaxID=2056283 RepID=UPI00130506BE|nr:hypothetical protein [Acidimangrovimonas sediminis]
MMKLSALILAALMGLGALATPAFACERHEASACADGQSWDAAADACVPKIGS